MSKVMYDDEKTQAKEWLPGRIILAVIVTVFTIFLFIEPKGGCHPIDQDALYCRMHPASIFQILGCLIFYAGAFVLSGLWKGWLTLYNPANSVKWNLLAGAGLLIGALLIWFG